MLGGMWDVKPMNLSHSRLANPNRASVISLDDRFEAIANPKRQDSAANNALAASQSA